MALAKKNFYAKIILENCSGFVILRFASFNLPVNSTLRPWRLAETSNEE
jgi:hypothetical protein